MKLVSVDTIGMIATPQQIGARLRTLRREKGISIEELADLSGLSARTIRRREKAGYDRLPEIEAVCLALDTHPAPVLFQVDQDRKALAIAALLPSACLEVIEAICRAR